MTNNNDNNSNGKIVNCELPKKLVISILFSCLSTFTSFGMDDKKIMFEFHNNECHYGKQYGDYSQNLKYNDVMIQLFQFWVFIPRIPKY